MFSLAAAIRALCSRRYSISTTKSLKTDRRVRRAAAAVAEAME
ncbi:MAG TPA: hypothetical protein VFC78_04825 [Tepidisphaeraceae bacterium]|nr:hypothetical protein [Tepidisphaeraceae bacterium]